MQFWDGLQSRLTDCLTILRTARFAHALVVAVAVALPWSTSLAVILITIWFATCALTFDWRQVFEITRTPVGGLPVFLCLLGVLGTTWAEAPFSLRAAGVLSFTRLLALPLLITQYRQSPWGRDVLIAFLLSSTALLAASYIVWLWPVLPHKDIGVPVKTYISQSIEFSLSAAILLQICERYLARRNVVVFFVLIIIALGFLISVFFIASGRTTFLILIALMFLYGFRRAGLNGILIAALIGTVIFGALWTTSPYLKSRLSSIYSEVWQGSSNSLASTGIRLLFWQEAIGIIQQAPLLGHGTGSIGPLYRGLAGDLATDNPHNQTLSIGIELGIAGMAALWAMWISQLALFRGGGALSWIGSMFVLQNLVGSLFNSFIFDFTEGWLYIFGAGIAAGMVENEFRSKAKLHGENQRLGDIEGRDSLPQNSRTGQPMMLTFSIGEVAYFSLTTVRAWWRKTEAKISVYLTLCLFVLNLGLELAGFYLKPEFAQSVAHQTSIPQTLEIPCRANGRIYTYGFFIFVLDNGVNLKGHVCRDIGRREWEFDLEPYHP